MKITELAEEYRQQSEKLKEKAETLRRRIKKEKPSGETLFQLQRNICMYEDMAAECFFTWCKLKDYYRE